MFQVLIIKPLYLIQHFVVLAYDSACPLEKYTKRYIGLIQCTPTSGVTPASFASSFPCAGKLIVLLQKGWRGLPFFEVHIKAMFSGLTGLLRFVTGVVQLVGNQDVNLTWAVLGGVIPGLPLTMSTPPDNKRSLRKQLKQKLRSAFSVTKSRNLDVPDAGPSTSAATGATTPHSVSPAHSNPHVDLVQETVIVNPNPTSAQVVTGVGELIGYALVLRSSPQPSSQIMDPMRRSTFRFSPLRPEKTLHLTVHAL
jgi:hypothetical protein